MHQPWLLKEGRMPSKTGTAEKILSHLKDLRNHMQAGEVPVFTVPAIWDAGQGQRSMPCDVVVTNQRIFGYVYVSFPRDRLLVSDGQRKIYIRAPRQKIENLYEELRAAIEQYAPGAQTALVDVETSNTPPVYGRQEIRTSFERSPLGITLLFVGGLLLEIGGIVLWAVTQSLQTGLPLFIAGLVAVITAILIRRQRG
jgi:hypothetical protein